MHYKGYMITTKTKEEDGKTLYRCFVHAKWFPLYKTAWWSDEEYAVNDAKGDIEQRLRDREK